jgi:predicted transcriptional regulator
LREGVAGVLGDDNHEFTDLLASLGVQRNVAKVITYLVVAGEATSKEIERGAGLRQPEVSIAMRILLGENWVREWEIKNTEGKGRPSKVYALSTPVDGIIRSIEDQKQKTSAEAMENIRKLKELASS